MTASRHPTAESAADTLRLDKWLWAARFFKTRALAVAAIEGGRVHVDGQRVKPGRAIRPGNRLEIHKDGLAWTVAVRGLSRQRRPASEAALLYEEDESSRLRRQELVHERRIAGIGAPDGRPDKRDRRLIRRFTGRDAADADRAESQADGPYREDA